MIRFRSVRKRYGALTVLENVSFEISVEICAIGPQWSRKTTIIRILLDFTQAGSGGVINGISVGCHLPVRG